MDENGRDGRDGAGRFKKGHPGGPGRPKQDRHLVLLRETVSEADWVLIVAAAIDQAKDGDRHAREWLGRYMLPDPSKATEDADKLLGRVILDFGDG